MIDFYSGVVNLRRLSTWPTIFCDKIERTPFLFLHSHFLFVRFVHFGKQLYVAFKRFQQQGAKRKTKKSFVRCGVLRCHKWMREKKNIREWEASAKPKTKPKQTSPAILRTTMPTKTTYLGFVVWAGHVTIGCGQNSRPAFKQTVVEIFGVQTFWQFQPMVKTTVAFFVVGAAAREKEAK